jgi:hypothetical protein
MTDLAPRPNETTNPHDAYTKSVFREIPQARGFFRGYLPPEVQGMFDWRTLRLETESFLSDQLQRDFADLRFSIRLMGDRNPHRITLLFEHKNRVTYTTPRQLHRYISRQWEETPDAEPLPSILTVVLLQSGTWKRARSLSSEYALPEPARRILAPYLVDFQMVMVELSALAEDDLRGTESGRLALALLKSVGEGGLMGWLRLRSLLRDLIRGLSPEQLRRELRRALYYLLSVTNAPRETELRQALQSIQDEFLPVKENIMTLLEHLEKRGEKRGQHLGKANTLIRWLSSVFPGFSAADAERVSKLPDEVLDELTDRVAQHATWVEIERILRRPDDA